jgi:hypothetical protein
MYMDSFELLFFFFLFFYLREVGEMLTKSSISSLSSDDNVVTDNLDNVEVHGFISFIL